MNKTIKYIGFVAAAFLTACSSDDLPLTSPDAFTDADLIGFAKNMDVQTRGYEDYNSEKHPGTMGVFGYHDLCPAAVGSDKAKYIIFENVQQDAGENAGNPDATTGTVFTYYQETDKQYWPEFSWSTSFDFFGYMPKVDRANVNYSSEGYSLSFLVNLSSKPILVTKEDLQSAPLICATPVHKVLTGEKITFKMDQTLLKYEVKFRLGTKMDAIREFKIKKVEVVGEVPVSGTVSRSYTYTYNGETLTWTAGNVTWSDIKTEDLGKKTVVINNETNPLILNGGTTSLTDYVAVDGCFYAIPSNYITLRVTYDVHVDNGDNTEMTRKDVVSTITLNSTNFSTFNPTSAIIDQTNGATFEVLIQPSYLYVLADGDHSFGIEVK